jgi:hypothetical protein
MNLHAVRLGVLLAIGVSTLACAAAPEEPSQVAKRYFRYRRNDPLRLLLLLTPEFHRSHGMTLDSYLRSPPGAALLASRSRTAPEPAPWTLDRAQVAWLDAQESLSVQKAASRLRFTIESAEASGDRARVRSRVTGPSGPPFTQDFALVRDPASGVWRIESIEQAALDPSNLLWAFAASPSYVTAERLFALGALR